MPHTIAAGEKAAWEKSLAANTVDAVTVASDTDTIRVHLDSGSTAIYFTTDGSTPTVGGATCHRVRAVAGDWAEVAVTGATRRAGITVRLVSAGAVTYSVERSV